MKPLNSSYTSSFTSIDKKRMLQRARTQSSGFLKNTETLHRPKDDCDLLLLGQARPPYQRVHKAVNTCRGDKGTPPKKILKEKKNNLSGGCYRHALKQREVDNESKPNLYNRKEDYHFLPLVLDLGTHITVVPEDMVDKNLLSTK